MQPAAAQSSAPVRISPPISAGAGTYRLIAGAGGRQVGSVMVHAHDKDTVEVTDLHVAEAQRGQGIGRMLLTSVARTGAQFGRSKVTLAAQDTGTGHLDSMVQGHGVRAGRREPTWLSAAGGTDQPAYRDRPAPGNSVF